ncbi:MAG: metallophosphoesterase [Bacteroidales bacterium]|nr:metallophosphoesterase [Bacteroidales bacterium]
MLCFFVTDIHGKTDRYKKLFDKIEQEKPSAVFLGGDLLPSGLQYLTTNSNFSDDFIEDILKKGFSKLKDKLKDKYPRVFLILGNDDGKAIEQRFINIAKEGIWEYVHNQKVNFENFVVYGYSYIPPTPFLLKDWERYDVSRYVDPGCVPPTEGYHSVKEKKDIWEYSTIKEDLDLLTAKDDLSNAIFLFHSPPYKTKLDRAALDGKMIDYTPLDVHVGSIAIERFIKTRQPLLSLHGHVHESTSITGSWHEKIGKTLSINAAHNKKELCLVKINLNNLDNCSMELI